MKKKVLKSKYIKYLLIFVVVLVIVVLIALIYRNLFAESNSTRLEGIENYELTKGEISSVKEKINTLENIESVDVYTNYKIIKIFVHLSEDIEFDKIKDISNQVIEEFSEENLGYYDLEFFVESSNEESEIYPKVGYKHKSNSEFVWNR